jgi:regulator of RNase E activity RraA
MTVFISLLILKLDLKNAIWGGLMTAGAQARGARGVVISGRCRDLAEQRAAKFPVFARGHSTVGSSPFTRATNVQVPIQIEPIHEPDAIRAEGLGKVFPGVTIRPGDWVVADVDGVVCIPRELMGRTKELAAEGRAIDAHCLEDIRAGKGVAEAFRKWRGK